MHTPMHTAGCVHATKNIAFIEFLIVSRWRIPDHVMYSCMCGCWVQILNTGKDDACCYPPTLIHSACKLYPWKAFVVKRCATDGYSSYNWIGASCGWSQDGNVRSSFSKVFCFLKYMFKNIDHDVSPFNHLAFGNHITVDKSSKHYFIWESN